ncbi:unnamed protein product [Symbiodinium sp. CCMP2456]|nr:unnamed protein product [Symbiodinium sp. CCMP2456]
MGILAGKPRKAFDHPGVYDTEDFVRQCFVPTEGLVCTRQNKGYFHSRTMDYMGAPPGDDEAKIQLCSYIIHDCTVQDKQCNLNISAKGLEVQEERRLLLRWTPSSSEFKLPKQMKRGKREREEGYEGYVFFLERSTYQNQVLGLCFDGRRGGESLDDAKFTVRQLLCDIPVYAYECPQWATARECGHMHPEEMREVTLLRTANSGVFCFGSLGWFSWDQEGCDADIWTCSFGPCNGYKKSERVCAATLSESYICYFDPTRPGVGEQETAFDYPLLRGMAMAALSVLTLAAGISACYFGAPRVLPLLCSFGWTPLIVLTAIVMSAGIGFMMEAAMIVLLPGVTPYSLVGGPRFPEARRVSVADLGGAWKSEQSVPPGFNQPSLWVLIEVAMTEVLMIFAFTFIALIPPIVFIVRHRNDRARAAGALNRRLLPDPFVN